MESTKIVQNILNTSKLQTVSGVEKKEEVDVREVLLETVESYKVLGKRIDIQIVAGRISIENECTPLSGEVLANIFKAFYRPDFSRNKKDGGTGLGFYIAQDILTNENLKYSFTPSDLGMKFIIECQPGDE